MSFKYKGFLLNGGGSAEGRRSHNHRSCEERPPTVFKATERFEKQLNFLTMREHIIFVSKINYSLLADQSILKSEHFFIYEV